MAITPLPPVPQTSDPANFAAKADAFLAALAQFVIEANALGNVGSPVSSNYLSGLTLSTAGSSATFGIAIGQAADAANAIMMALGSAYTKTTSAWALGTGNGAMDTGSVGASTWYHVYLIQRPDTLVTDILFSLSVSAPTMPTNYTRKRRIGSMKTNGSSQWTKFVQFGDEFMWDAAVLDVNIANLSTTETLETLSVPTGLQVIARIRGITNNSTVSTKLLLHSTDAADVVPSSGNFTAVVQVTNVNTPFTIDIRTNTSAQIKAVADTASTTLQVNTYGWFDARGRNG